MYRNIDRRNEKIKDFFDKSIYLRKNYRIAIRSIIVKKLLGNVKKTKILDLGCGDGSISLQFLSETNKITLIDLSKSMLEKAKQKTPEEFIKNVSYVNSDFYKYDFGDQFDIILCIGVLAHVSSIEETIIRISHLLNKGGLCILQITDYEKTIAKMLYAYESFINFIVKSYKYRLNKTTLSQVKLIAYSNGLSLIDNRQYLLAFPGISKLPDDFLFKLQLLALNNRFLLKLCSENMLLFKK